MTAAAAYGYTAVIVIVAGFGVYAASILAGHGQISCLRRTAAFRATRAALRVLIAVRADYLTFIGLVETWRQSGAPERTRT